MSEASELLRSFELAEWKYSCNGITPADVDAATAYDPNLAHRIEAIMVTARQVLDADGLRTHIPMPPALALAIIRKLESLA